MGNKADKLTMRITYNAPITLTFSLFTVLVYFSDQYLSPGLIDNIFTLDGRGSFNMQNPVSYIKLFTYIFGHADVSHLVSNLMLMLLLGPLIEERYGSSTLLGMIFFAAVLNGFINILFFPSQLIGSSGIVFMLMLLSSFANVRRGDIPLTFICIVFLYLTKEFTSFFDSSSDISNISHLIGGLCGAIFGFIEGSWKRTSAPTGRPDY